LHETGDRTVTQPMTSSSTVDLGSLIDEGPWTVYQKLLVLAAAMTIILDGLDNQLLAAALPALMREWHLARPAFVPVQTAGMVGMMVGGFIGGFVGDRFGRRVALLGSVVVFGVLTVLVAFAGGVAILTALRFLAGLGLGGAMPNAAALSSEYVPRRQRPFAVTLTIVCIPLGGSLAGIVGGQILPRFGWRGLFLVGGIVPLVMAAVLLKVLPESPRFFGAAARALGAAPGAPAPRGASRVRRRGVRRHHRKSRCACVRARAARAGLSARHAGTLRVVLLLLVVGLRWGQLGPVDAGGCGL